MHTMSLHFPIICVILYVACEDHIFPMLNFYCHYICISNCFPNSSKHHLSFRTHSQLFDGVILHLTNTLFVHNPWQKPPFTQSLTSATNISFCTCSSSYLTQIMQHNCDTSRLNSHTKKLFTKNSLEKVRKSHGNHRTRLWEWEINRLPYPPWCVSMRMRCAAD